MNSNLGVGQTLELLERLRGILREFAASEDKLNQEFRLRISAERRRGEETVVEETGRLTGQLEAAAAGFQSAKETVEAKYGRRKARISKGRQASKEQALERIESRTGTRKYELQKQLIQTDRDREAGLAAAAMAFEESRSQLATELGNLDSLENKARHLFRGYGGFSRRLADAAGPHGSVPDLDENQLMTGLRETSEKTGIELERFQKRPLPLLFRFLPIWALLVLCLTPLVLQRFGIISLSQQGAVAGTAALVAGMVVIYLLGRRQASPAVGSIAGALGKARRLHAACLQKSELRYQRETERIQKESKAAVERIDQQLSRVLKEAAGLKGTYREQVDEKTVRVSAKNEKWRHQKLEQLERDNADAVQQLKRVADTRTQAFANAHEAKLAKLDADYQARWHSLETEWTNSIQPIRETIETANAAARQRFPPWTGELVTNWSPPAEFKQAVEFAHLSVDTEKLSEVVPKDQRLAWPGASRFSLPLLLTYPGQGSMLFETSGTGRGEAMEALNNIVLRLLFTAPPGRLNFTIVDPVGLGQSFAGVMHLADYEEKLINGRIWTQSGQIEQRLAELNEHMEKVIQMYLRNEYETIAEYNEAAGNIAEKYHFLVVADFPTNFSDVAINRLLGIAASGARCGVYTLIHWDHRPPAAQNLIPEEFRKTSVCLTFKGREFTLTGKTLTGASLALDQPPAQDLATEIIHKVGRSSIDSSRVEVPFAQVAPRDLELWTVDTTGELRVPIGRTGATKLQYLAIGKGTRQHALIAGKTGSGKSTLFHVIITNLSLWCSPEQVEFYLIDFKKGVEFKCYATKRLPHARVVAIESDREFGLSVLQRVDDELRRRGDLFRKLGVQDLAGYKRAGGTESVPRSLLMIDEFQEFFVEDDKVSQGASLLLDRIVRQGRAFGVHVVLGSQTLGGAYTVARATLGQMVIRIALQCNEADAYLIMDESNPAPRLLSRPGEGIYNDAAGAVEGNSPFQAVWLSDDVRDLYLEKVRERAGQGSRVYPGPIVFEGDAPAEVEENTIIQGLLKAESIRQPAFARIWLGAPNSIKGPTEAAFHQQSGSSLLVVGQRDEAVLAMLSIALISLAAQHPPGAARFILFDGASPGLPQRNFLDRIIQIIPHPVTVGKPADLADILNGLAEEIKKRAEDGVPGAPAIFLFFHGLQRHGKLRQDDNFSFASDDAAVNPAARLDQLICEGPRVGLHVVATFDTYNNVNRFLSRKALSEFGMRVLFQMSANDSASLIDSPRAGALGLHRALFYNEQEGYTEVFRPYALPNAGWVEQAALDLARLLK